MHIFNFRYVPKLLLNPDSGAGGDGGSGQGNGDGSGGAKGDIASQNDAKKFTQADMDRVAGERAQRAGEAAINKLLESLGVKSPDEIKASLDKIKTLEDAQKSELQKAQDDAAKFKAQAEKNKTDAEVALAKANERLLQSAVLLEAQKQNVEESELVSVWRDLKESPKLREKIKQDDAGEFEGVSDAVKEIVKAHPKWLKAGQRPSPGTPKGGEPNKSKAEGAQKLTVGSRNDY